MPEEKKPGWTYCYSEVLKENFAIHNESGWVYFNTPQGIVKYSPEELKIIEKSGQALDQMTHNVKTMIGGEIVGYENGKVKTNKSAADNSHTAGTVQAVNGNNEGKKELELDIY